MKKNLFVTTLLLLLTIILIPIHSYAATEVDHSIEYDLPSLQSADTSITWSIAAGVAKTKSIACTEGETVNLSCGIAPSSGKVKLGVIDPDGIYHTASLTGNGEVSYEIPSTGTYKIYCKNAGTSTISVAITYQIK